MNGTFVNMNVTDDASFITLDTSTGRLDFRLDDDCVSTLNGKECGLGDLIFGDAVEVDGQPAVAVRASRVVTKEDIRIAEKTKELDHREAELQKREAAVQKKEADVRKGETDRNEFLHEQQERETAWDKVHRRDDSHD